MYQLEGAGIARVGHVADPSLYGTIISINLHGIKDSCGFPDMIHAGQKVEKLYFC